MCLCDDFLNIGSNQFLILWDGFDKNKGWLLTNCSTVHIDCIHGPSSTDQTACHEGNDVDQQVDTVIDSVQGHLQVEFCINI